MDKVNRLLENFLTGTAYKTAVHEVITIGDNGYVAIWDNPHCNTIVKRENGLVYFYPYRQMKASSVKLLNDIYQYYTGERPFNRFNPKDAMILDRVTPTWLVASKYGDETIRANTANAALIRWVEGNYCSCCGPTFDNPFDYDNVTVTQIF